MLESIVIDHWSSNGKLLPQHANEKHRNVFKHHNLVNLKKQIIELFSFDTQTVIDADPLNG